MHDRRPPEKMRPGKDKKKLGFGCDVWSWAITMLQVLLSDVTAPYGPGVDLPNLVYMVSVGV